MAPIVSFTGTGTPTPSNTHGLDVHLTEAEPSQKYIAEGDVKKNGTQSRSLPMPTPRRRSAMWSVTTATNAAVSRQSVGPMEAVKRKGPKRKGQAKDGTAAVAKPQLEAWAALEEVGDGQDHVAAAGSARANGRVETETSGSGAVAKPQLEAWAALEEVGDSQDHVAAAGSARANSGVETKVCDSGASRHMSPFREHFVPSKTIAPCTITAADKWVFYPIGVGDPKVKVSNESDPKSLSEARSRADWLDWKAAMDRELETLEKAGTWRTVSRPECKNAIGSKWAFKAQAQGGWVH